jgi:quercetin dioxygenase-like cupin family protein
MTTSNGRGSARRGSQAQGRGWSGSSPSAGSAGVDMRHELQPEQRYPYCPNMLTGRPKRDHIPQIGRRPPTCQDEACYRGADRFAVEVREARTASYPAPSEGQTWRAVFQDSVDFSTWRALLHSRPRSWRRGKALTAVQVDYAPGGASKPHHHSGVVLAYVVSGEIRSQVDNAPPRVYHARYLGRQQGRADPVDRPPFSLSARLFAGRGFSGVVSGLGTCFLRGASPKVAVMSSSNCAKPG